MVAYHYLFVLLVLTSNNSQVIVHAGKGLTLLPAYKLLAPSHKSPARLRTSQTPVSVQSRSLGWALTGKCERLSVARSPGIPIPGQYGAKRPDSAGQ